MIQNYDKNTFKKDFFASLVVFFIALPLAVGISIASGLPAEAGIISSIIGGIIVGFFSGSPLQISGPAAGLIVIIYEIVQKFGIPSLGIIVFTAGIIQIAFGVLKWGKWFRAISPAIIQGMLSAIGLSIIFSQFHIMIDSVPGKNVLENITTIPIDILFSLNASTHHLAAGMGILTISIIISGKYIPKKYNFLPPTLIAVIIVATISFIFNVSMPCLLLDMICITVSKAVAESAAFFPAVLPFLALFPDTFFFFENP